MNSQRGAVDLIALRMFVAFRHTAGYPKQATSRIATFGLTLSC